MGGSCLWDVDNVEQRFLRMPSSVEYVEKGRKEVVQPQQEERRTLKWKNQNTGKKSKGGIVALLIILCICVAITGFIVGRKKETAFSDGGNSVISKIKGEKKEEEINGAWNEFSQYYKGYVYYIKQLALDENELYRQKGRWGRTCWWWRRSVVWHTQRLEAFIYIMIRFTSLVTATGSLKIHQNMNVIYIQ